MRLSIPLLLAATCVTALAQSKPDPIAIAVDGKPFANFHYGVDANKPFLAPLRSASGKAITRGFPMETIEGESKDHLHHRGMWFTYDDVNGVKFWENDPSYTRGAIGKVVVKSAQLKGNVLTATMEWRAPDGKVLIVETQRMAFTGDAKQRMIDFQTTLAASTDLTLGDTKEGAFAIRLHDNFTARKGGKMMDSEGRNGMAAIWGKRAKWVGYTAEVGGEDIGVAIMDHPANPRHPTYWHARDYGLFALNPFGRKSFDRAQEESKWQVPAGQKLAFRWAVLIHPGDLGAARLNEMYAAWTKK
jgi:hypothetical protein